MLMRKMSSGLQFRKHEIPIWGLERRTKKVKQWLMFLLFRSFLLPWLLTPLLVLPITSLSSVLSTSKKVKFNTQMGMRWILQILALFIRFLLGMEILLFPLGIAVSLLMLILLERNWLRALIPWMKTPLSISPKRVVGNLRRSSEKKRLRDLRLKEVSPPSKCLTGGIRELGLQREQ